MGGFGDSLNRKEKFEKEFGKIFGQKNPVSFSYSYEGSHFMTSEEKFNALKSLCEKVELRYNLFPANICSLAYDISDEIDEKDLCSENNAQGLHFTACPGDMFDGAVGVYIYQPKTMFFRVSFIPGFETISQEILKQIGIASAEDIISLEQLTTKIKELRNGLERFLYVDFSDLWEHPRRYKLCQSCYENPERVALIRGKYSEDLRKALRGLTLDEGFFRGEYGSEMKVEEVEVK